MAHYTIDGNYVDNIEHFGLVENFLGGKVVKATPAPKAGSAPKGSIGATGGLGSGVVVKATPAPTPKAGGVAMGVFDAIGGSLGEGKASSALPGSLNFGKSVSSSIVDKSCPTCPPVKICPACPPEKICPTSPTCPPEKKSCIIS
jgi:hypothetical protein